MPKRTKCEIPPEKRVPFPSTRKMVKFDFHQERLISIFVNNKKRRRKVVPKKIHEARKSSIGTNDRSLSPPTAKPETLYVISSGNSDS